MKVLSTYLSALRSSIRPVWHLQSDRLWEIDMMRGVAIVMMVVYHFMWDLRGLAGYDINVYTGFWHIWQQITANFFIGIAGVSLTLSYGRAKNRDGKTSSSWGKFVIRGAVVLTWGLVVSVVTYFVDPSHYVRFGILHLIGVSIIIAYPFLRFRWLNLVLGIMLLLMAQIIPFFGLDNPWLAPLGLNAFPPQSFDYFPLIPWFGVVLLGIFLGNSLYTDGQRRFNLPDIGNAFGIRTLRLLGQNSLLIYLLHQPIMIFFLVLLGQVRL